MKAASAKRPSKADILRDALEAICNKSFDRITGATAACDMQRIASKALADVDRRKR
jgi:hypothetical protein